MKTVKVGSRDSLLAVAQAKLVMAAIGSRYPGVRLELVTMKTSGDRVLDQPLEAIGGKGLFIRELDDALRAGRVDICVHSYKDMPVPENPELPVVAVTRREDPRDVLVLPPGADAVPPGRAIGTSSARRRHQLRELYPSHECRPVRGNLTTRLRKLDSGEFGALVLAAAGLRRLGLWERASRIFTVEEMIPCSCQGMLAVQGRAGEDYGYLLHLEDPEARAASAAERAFIEALGADCTAPVAAYAAVEGNDLRLTGLFVDRQGHGWRGEAHGRRDKPERAGRDLARRLAGGEG